MPRLTDPGEYFTNLVKDKKNQNYRGYSTFVSSVNPESPIPEGHTRFVCISDTHAKHRELDMPKGDVLLHGGDFTHKGEVKTVDDFNEWLGTLPYKHKVVIAGNHELTFCPKMRERTKRAKESDTFMRFNFLKDIPEELWGNWKTRMNNCIYLEDEEVTINGIRIYGSPWTPEFCDFGFNVKRGEPILEKWNLIPDGIDILITHGPPAGKLDTVAFGVSTGCIELLNTVQLRVQPKYHLFGHIHEAPGYVTDGWTRYINASMVNKQYHADRKPIIFDFPNPIQK